jgi:hypothetical protein
MLVNITGGPDMTLFEVDAAAERVTQVKRHFVLISKFKIRISKPKIRISNPKIPNCAKFGFLVLCDFRKSKIH